MISLEEVAKQYTAAELREREDFILEATHLMRERLLMQPVFERLGWEVPVWVEWAQNTSFMKGFRQMLFSKIVPNLSAWGCSRRACARSTPSSTCCASRT